MAHPETKANRISKRCTRIGYHAVGKAPAFTSLRKSQSFCGQNVKAGAFTVRCLLLLLCCKLPPAMLPEMG